MKLEHKPLAYTYLRVAMGLMFFMYGLGKLRGGIGAFVTGLTKKFADKLPEFIVWPFATALPFLELAIGLLLIAGLFTRWALVAAGALMVILVFGSVAIPDPPTVGVNMVFVFLLGVLLFGVDQYDDYSADVYLKKKR